MAEYSARIVDHFKNPRNIGEMDVCDAKAFVGNPVCGDQIHLFARVEGDRIIECTFLAYGCAASIATASILTEELPKRSLDDLSALEERDIVEMVGGLTPTQHHCATIGRDVVHVLVASYRTGGEASSAHGDRCV
jgi:nitrogen fixation NifU-like protein